MIQDPYRPIPSYDYRVETLSPLQIDGLNNIFDQFDQVENTLEPVDPGSATTYENWYALCLGEESTGECHESAEHESSHVNSTPYPISSRT